MKIWGRPRKGKKINKYVHKDIRTWQREQEIKERTESESSVTTKIRQYRRKVGQEKVISNVFAYKSFKRRLEYMYI